MVSMRNPSSSRRSRVVMRSHADRNVSTDGTSTAGDAATARARPSASAAPSRVARRSQARRVLAHVPDRLLDLGAHPLLQRAVRAVECALQPGEVDGVMSGAPLSFEVGGDTPERADHRTLDPLGVDASRGRADAARVAAGTAVDALPAARGGALRAVATRRAAQEAGQQPCGALTHPRQATPVGVLRSGPQRDVHDGLVGFCVDVAIVAPVAQLAEVDPVGDHVVDRLLAPGPRALRRGDALALQQCGQLGGAAARCPALEDGAHDGRGHGIGLQGAVLAPAVADRRARDNRDTALDRLGLRPLEARPGALADVGGQQERETALELPFRGGPVRGRVGRVDDATGVGHATHEPVGVLTVAREAIQPRHDDPARLAGLDAAQRLVQAGTVQLAARLVEVGREHLAHLKAMLDGVLTSAALLLVGGRSAAPRACRRERHGRRCRWGGLA